MSDAERSDETPDAEDAGGSGEGPAPSERREGIQALRVASTRIEEVAIGSLVDEEDDTVFEEVQGLHAASIQTEGVETDDTPLVVLDEADQLDTDSDELSVPALVGEVKRLRSHNQILRTERTSIAGRKYALEIVIESLREKVDQAGGALDELEAAEEPIPEALSGALHGLRLVLEDARRIADTKAVLEKDLEEERRRHLEERQEFEQKAFEHEQAIRGLREERDSLRATVARVEGDRLTWMERLAEVQEKLEDEEIERGRIEAEAAAQVESYAERLRELESREESERAALLESEQRLEQARELTRQAQSALEKERDASQANASLGDTFQAEAQAAREERDALQGELEKALAGKAQAEQERDALQSELDSNVVEAYAQAGEKTELEERLQELERELGKVSADAKEASATFEREREELTSERDASLAERDGLVAERDGLAAERDGLVAERDGLVAERDGLVAERDGLVAERDGLVAERDGLAAERDGATADLDALSVERDELLREVAHLTEERDQAATSRDELAEQLAGLEAELQAVRDDALATADKLSEVETAAKRSTLRLEEAGQKLASAQAQAASLGGLEARLAELEQELATAKALSAEQKKALKDVKPLVEDWSRLDKECQRLSRLVGEARARGRVDVQELIARAALLRRLEKLTS